MESITTSWGETLPLTVEAEDANNATLYIGEVGNIVIEQTAAFIDGSADLTVTAIDMEIPPDTYSYQIVIEYDNGDIRKYPDASCEDCELPTITVCATIDMPMGS
jgi:hypothetical protein